MSSIRDVLFASMVVHRIERSTTCLSIACIEPVPSRRVISSEWLLIWARNKLVLLLFFAINPLYRCGETG